MKDFLTLYLVTLAALLVIDRLPAWAQVVAFFATSGAAVALTATPFLFGDLEGGA